VLTQVEIACGVPSVGRDLLNAINEELILRQQLPDPDGHETVQGGL
jgi:hypothetical protein